MKISNFMLNKTYGNRPMNWEYEGTVDIETGFWFWKKIKRVKVRREYAGFWYFVDTGEFTPGRKVENLARSWRALTGQDC